LLLLFFFNFSPATILLLKLVDKQLQSFSLGLLKCMNILLAYIPAPIVFSKLIDDTCILWNNECNDDKGTCLEHDLSAFHYIFLGVALGVKGISFIVLIIAFVYIHKRKVFKPYYSKKITLNSKRGRSERKRTIEISSIIADSVISNESLKRFKNTQSDKNDISIVCIKRAKSSESLDTIMTSISSSSSNASGNTFSSGSSGKTTKSNKLTMQSNDLSSAQMDIIHEEQGEIGSSF
jgi:hypothetical protein